MPVMLMTKFLQEKQLWFSRLHFYKTFQRAIDEKTQKRIQNPKHVLWSIQTGKKETRSLRRCIPSLSAWRRNEIRRRRPTKAPTRCSIFVEQGPMGNSMAITAHYVFEQLRRGRNPEHLHPCTQACTVHLSMNQHTWTYADGQTHAHTAHSWTWASNLCSVSWT